MTLFKKLRATALALLPLALLAPAPASAQPGDLALIESHIDKVATMRANFVQTDRRGRSAAGTLLLKRPGKIRFDYGKDENLLVVADGKSLNMIDYDVRQVQRWPIGNSPLSALLDPSRDLGRYGKLLPTANPNVLSLAVKDPKRPEYGTITMIFLRDPSAPGGISLQSWVALDSQNNRTTVRLTNIRYNQPIADKAFNWDDPRPKRRGGR